MQIHAQSTSTLAESRPPYIHLGYCSASPSTGFGTFDSEIFLPGVVLFLVGYLIALKFNYGWLFGGLSVLFKKVGFLKIAGVSVSILLFFGLVFLYYFSWIFH